MSINDSVVDRYIAIWNETDPAHRRELVGQAFTEDATYTDPLLLGAGHDNLDRMFAAAQAQLPGARVSVLGEPDQHHGWVRFQWKLHLDGSDDSLIDGIDIGRIAPDGRFEHIVGFLDKVPAGIAP
jgi:hypothetical protein